MALQVVCLACLALVTMAAPDKDFWWMNNEGSFGEGRGQQDGAGYDLLGQESAPSVQGGQGGRLVLGCWDWRGARSPLH